MTVLVILLAAATMLVLAVAMSFILGWANKTFHVEIDPRVEQVIEALPGANCGGCGCVGCAEYAEAVVAGALGPDKCPVGGAEVAARVAEILGVDLEQSWPYRPVVHCGATYGDRLQRAAYRGEPTCASANLISGVQGCTYGCLGLGDCERACRFDAIHMIDGLASVDYERCTGCGACERACPRHIISMAPFKSERMVAVACSNLDFGKDVKAVCKVGCLGCKACQRVSKVLDFADNLPRIDYDKYDAAFAADLAAAIDKCPAKRFVLVGKPSAADLAAVAGEEAPAVVTPTFETTVDKTDWYG